MTGRELLYSLKDYDSDINKKIELLEKLKSSAIGITAKTDKESVQSNGDQDKIGSIIAKVVDLENEINSKTFDLLKKRDIAKRVIFQLEKEIYQDVLYDIFICNIRLYQVAETYDITYKNAEKIRNKAIKEFDLKFNASEYDI